MLKGKGQGSKVKIVKAEIVRFIHLHIFRMESRCFNIAGQKKEAFLVSDNVEQRLFMLLSLG